MIETEGEFSFKKWGGILLAIAFLICGVVSIVTQQSYFPKKHGYVLLVGLQAIFAGMAYSGIGIALFGYFFLQYSERLYRWERPVVSFGLVVAIVGVALVIWRFIVPR